mmetsp:Transcript_22780/g.29505  ORF Transcript_22780/g.29505 Transcript_22780/m.29505 type:complete len:140 (+) Transcript_22780:64-483(+)
MTITTVQRSTFKDQLVKRERHIKRPARESAGVGALVERLQTFCLEQKLERPPMIFHESKRRKVMNDIQTRGYHLVCRRGIPRALIIPDSQILIDHLSGRVVQFRDHSSSSNEDDRNCHSDGEENRRSATVSIPSRCFDI